MLIGLVRDSVMQCFCHTCRAPILLPSVSRKTAPLKKGNKIRVKQPRLSKKVKFITTEIRCQEKSRGGLSYEVILAEPAPNVPAPKRPVTPGKNLSVDDIEQKLKAAEERRVSLEQKKMADLSNKLAKIEEASRKKDELNIEFINQTREQLESKMEQHVEKREAIISDIKEKMKIHVQEIEKTRDELEHQKYVEKVALEKKLQTAQNLRDENIQKMLSRLKEHNTIKIAENKKHIDELEKKVGEEKARIIANKLYTAELNREKEYQKKIEKIRELERRAELVRQKKEAAAAHDVEGGEIVGATPNQV